MAVKKKNTKKNATTKSNSKLKSSAKTKSGKPAFGGYAINFVNRKETLEQVFGNKPIAPSEMTKKIWAFVKANSLSNR